MIVEIIEGKIDCYLKKALEQAEPNDELSITMEVGNNPPPDMEVILKAAGLKRMEKTVGAPTIITGSIPARMVNQIAELPYVRGIELTVSVRS